MPKVDKKIEQNMTLEDWDRLAQALPHMVKACQHLDKLDWCVGYELGTEDNQQELDEAQMAARKALKLLGGTS